MSHLLSENNNSSKILLNTVVWDSDLENIGLPWYTYYSFGSEFGDIIYRLQKPKDKIRWCVYSVDRNYYIIKQEQIDKEWVEVWSKQMDKDLDEAKLYCEEDALEYLTQLQKSKISESFYCKYFTEDEFATSDEKCKNQCEYCKRATNL